MISPTHYYQMLVSPDVGGGARLAMELHKHVTSARGPSSRLLLPAGGEAEQTARRAGFAFSGYRLDRLTGTGRIGTAVENWRLYRQTSRHAYGLIHIHAPHVYGAARTFLQMSRLLKVLHIHLDFNEEQLRWSLQCPPDLVLVCAEFMRATVERAVASANGKFTRITVIRNAVDLEMYRPAVEANRKAVLDLPEDAPVLMVVANLAPHKGQATAIKSIAALKSRGILARLVLVGAERAESRGYAKDLQDLSSALGVGAQVTFLGFRSDVAQLLRAADFLLLPSTSEGLPLTILEAQASGLVVLAAPTAGIPEIIDDGRTGFLIGADDPESYASRVAWLLRNRDRWSEIAESALTHVRANHGIERFCSSVLDAYDAMAEQRWGRG